MFTYADLSLLPLLLLANPNAIPPIHTYAARTGRPSYLDTFLFSLGMQAPLSPTSLNESEYPACAAMTTGYIFRVENAATVSQLQKIGQTGHLTTLEVSAIPNPDKKYNWYAVDPRSITITYAFIAICGSFDTYLLNSLALLLISRLLSVFTLRARTAPSWHGEPEPGVKGDLLILLSEDRWIRMKGLVDDLKAVTSGSWLSRPTRPRLCDTMDWIASLLVYMAAVVLGNAGTRGQGTLILCVLISHAILAVHNALAVEMVINGRRVKVSQQPGSVKKYSRRLVMARELVKEMGRSDFAVRLGMLNPDDEAVIGERLGEEVVTM